MKFSEIITTIKDKFLETDKITHLALGFCISFLCGMLLTPLIEFAIAVIAGAAKEYIDSKGYGTPDIYDFIFTTFGALIAVPIMYLVCLF